MKVSDLPAPVPFSVLLALSLLLVSCGKPTVSGTYVAHDATNADLIEVVQSTGGQVTGRLEAVSLKPDGTLTDNNAALSGLSDGAAVSLSIQPNLLFSQPVQLTGKVSGNHLTLSGGGAVTTSDFVRSDIASFQKEDARLRQKSGEMLAAAAVAQAQVQAQQAAMQEAQREATAQAAFLDRLGKLNVRVSEAAATLDALRDKPAQIEATYQKITNQMASYLDRERALVGQDNRSAARGQIDVAINQGMVAMNQLHIQAQTGLGTVTSALQQLDTEINKVLASCGEDPRISAGPAVDSACGSLRGNAGRLKGLEARRAGLLQVLEAVYQRELGKQQAIVAQADRIE